MHAAVKIENCRVLPTLRIVEHRQFIGGRAAIPSTTAATTVNSDARRAKPMSGVYQGCCRPGVAGAGVMYSGLPSNGQCSYSNASTRLHRWQYFFTSGRGAMDFEANHALRNEIIAGVIVCPACS